MTNKHRLEDLTFVEFRERIADDPVVLVPLGSQEEQGPMAPMGDFMLTRAIAERAAAEAGALAAPTLPFGHADYFRPVPGGIALRPETFKAVLRDTLDALLDHDLVRLIVVNGHGGNMALIDQVQRELKRERSVLVPCVNLWRSVPAELFSPAGAGHGADPLTSVYLHHFPELMRMDLAAPADASGELLGLPTDGLAAVRLRDLSVQLAVDVTDHTANGVTSGDPRNASAEAGARITDHLVTRLVALIRHMKGVDPCLAGA